MKFGKGFTSSASFLVLLAVLTPILPARADVFNMPPGFTNLTTVSVGNVNNPADGRYPLASGAVSYQYSIGQYDVTAGQYCMFLSAVAASDPYGLYNTNMDQNMNPYGCGIVRTGTDGSYVYGIGMDYANRPVNMVGFWDACRFVNWLGKGQPVGPEGNGTTETGTYTLAGMVGLDGGTIKRNYGAKWVLPTVDEWYKAAYYDPTLPVDAPYWTFPTRSNNVPSNAFSATGTNNANYTASGTETLGAPYHRNNVGAFGASYSYYNTFDQGGNVYQWTETNLTASARVARGGSFADGFDSMSAANGGALCTATFETAGLGFRVAYVPVPPPHDGDANNDTKVDVVDLGVLAKYYDMAFPPGTPTWQFGDFNKDLKVDVVDLGILAKNYDWAYVLGTSQAPEPATLALLVLAGAAIGRRRGS